MPPDSDLDPSVHVSDRSDPSTTVVAGFSAFGLAGPTAADYLADRLAAAEEGVPEDRMSM